MPLDCGLPQVSHVPRGSLLSGQAIGFNHVVFEHLDGTRHAANFVTMVQAIDCGGQIMIGQLAHRDGQRPQRPDGSSLHDNQDVADGTKKKQHCDRAVDHLRRAEMCDARVQQALQLVRARSACRRQGVKQRANDALGIGRPGMIAEVSQDLLRLLRQFLRRCVESRSNRLVAIASHCTGDVGCDALQRRLQCADCYAGVDLFGNSHRVSGSACSGRGQRACTGDRGGHFHGYDILRVEAVQVRIERQVGTVGSFADQIGCRLRGDVTVRAFECLHESRDGCRRVEVGATCLLICFNLRRQRGHVGAAHDSIMNCSDWPCVVDANDLLLREANIGFRPGYHLVCQIADWQKEQSIGDEQLHRDRRVSSHGATFIGRQRVGSGFRSTPHAMRGRLNIA